MPNRKNPMPTILLLAFSLILGGMLPPPAGAVTAPGPVREICSGAGAIGQKQLPADQKNHLHRCCPACGCALPALSNDRTAHRLPDLSKHPAHAAAAPDLARTTGMRPTDARPRAPPARTL
jgi:hypothetical protein